jgi:hypothetical protein
MLYQILVQGSFDVLLAPSFALLLVHVDLQMLEHDMENKDNQSAPKLNFFVLYRLSALLNID